MDKHVMAAWMRLYLCITGDERTFIRAYGMGRQGSWRTHGNSLFFKWCDGQIPVGKFVPRKEQEAKE